MNKIKNILIATLVLFAIMGFANAATPAPINLTDTTGVGWVQWDWNAGAGNVTDTYNISRTYDSTTTWFNATANDYIRWSGVSGESVTIVVFAYNTTYSEISTSVTDTVSVPMMFHSVVSLIDAIVPLFTSILDLIIAVFPLIIAMAFLAGLVILVGKIFDKSLNFGK